MIAAYDGKIYNDEQPFIDYTVKDMFDGQIYSIYLDTNDEAYAELSTNAIEHYDIIDGLTGVAYQLFVYNGKVFSAPVKSSTGDTIYANECFISAGATINLKIERNSDTLATVDDVVINIFNQATEQFLNLNIEVTELAPNFFKASFVIPFKGDFLAVVHVLTDTFLAKTFKVQNFSYQELVDELEKVKDKLNKNNYEAFI